MEKGDNVSEDLLLSSDDVRTGMISGETFDAKPVTYSVVEEEDPDTGEKIQLAMFEGGIVLGTVEEVEQETEEVRAMADAGLGEAPEGVVFGVGITGLAETTITLN